MKPFGVVTKSGKFVRREVFEGFIYKENESKQIKDDFQTHYKPDSLVPPLYNPATLAQLLELNTYHYRACKTKARDVAGLGYDLAQHKEDGAEETPDELAKVAELEAFLEGLDMPLPIIFEYAQLDFEAVGWGVVEATRFNDDPYEKLSYLGHVPSHTIRMHRDNNRYAQVRGLRKRWFKRMGHEKDVDKDTGIEYDVGSLPDDRRASELLVWRNYTPRSDYYGLPDVIPSLGAIHGDISRRDYNIAFFDNFGVPAYAIFITGKYDEGPEDEDGKTELEKTIEEHFKELNASPHSTLILSVPGTDVKVEFHPLAVDVKEASFRLYRQDNRDEVLSANGVDPYRAQIAETGSLGGNVSSQQTEIYKRSIIEPRQSVLEHLLTRHVVLGAFGVTTRKFKFAQIDTSDEKHEIEMVEKLYNMKAIDSMEVRRIYATRFGLDPDRVPQTLPQQQELDMLEKSLKDVRSNLQEAVLKHGSTRYNYGGVLASVGRSGNGTLRNTGSKTN